jgi:DNA polymerase III alpha subunit
MEQKMTDFVEYVPVHNHSVFSTFDGFMKVEDMVARCKELGFRAVALTDHGEVGGFIKLNAACKEHGIKPIFGTEAYLSYDLTSKKSQRYHLILLAKNEAGYKNILKLASIAYKNTAYNHPRIDFEILKQHREGLIISTACLGGEFAKRIISDDIDGAYNMVKNYHDIWGEDFYIEVMYHGIPEQLRVIEHAVKCSEIYGVKIIATNDSHYLTKDMAKYQQVKKAIAFGKPLDDNDVSHYYIKSYDEMSKIFNKQGLEYLHNTVEIANKCNYVIQEKKASLPNVIVPNNIEEFNEFKKHLYRCNEQTSYLTYLAHKGLKWRKLDHDPLYQERLERELEMIKFTGFVNYFLIVWEYCSWARENNIRIGAGRGSGVGSLVLFCLGVTGINPIPYDLSMDRFLYAEAEYHLYHDEIYSNSLFKEHYLSTGTGRRDRKLTKNENIKYQQLIEICKTHLSEYKFSTEEKDRTKKELLYLKERPSLVVDILDKYEYAKNNHKGDINKPNSHILNLIGITDKKADLSKWFDYYFVVDYAQSRISPPDIDIDFEHREKILQHLCDVYGKDNVALIGVNMTYKPKAAVQFAAKAIDITNTNNVDDKRFSPENDKEAKRLSKLMTGIGLSLKQWLGEDEKYIPSNRIIIECMENIQNEINKGGKYKEVFEVAKMLEGVIKGFGTHAAGVVISSRPIVEDIPLRVAKVQKDTNGDFDFDSDEDSDSEAIVDLMTTQFDMKEIEDVIGLLKFDFLQLNNLRQFTTTIDLIKQINGKDTEIDIDNLIPDDPKVFETINKMKLVGLFQISGKAFAGGDYPRFDKETGEVLRDDNGEIKTYHSKGVMEIIGCSDFQDIVAPNALGRPGPLNCGMPKKYKEGKDDPESIRYPHEKLKEVLSPTYGQLIYQEQLIKMAMILANMTFSQADELRRACAKKKDYLFAKIEPIFRNGCKNNNIPDQLINEMWSLAKEFGEYAFNRSHSTAYGYICYQSAWLKTYYPTEFICSLLTSEANKNDEKLEIMINSLKEEYPKLQILPPDINKSRKTYFPIGHLKVIAPFVSVKGIGKKVSDAIVECREDIEYYVSLEHFLRTINSSGKSVISETICKFLIDNDIFKIFGDKESLYNDLSRYNNIKKLTTPTKTRGTDPALASRIKSLF